MRTLKDGINFSGYVWSLREILRQVEFKRKRPVTTEENWLRKVTSGT